jgi:hypothetical protein
MAKIDVAIAVTSPQSTAVISNSSPICSVYPARREDAVPEGDH